MERAHEAISKIDLISCARYLETDFGVKTSCAWLRDKFARRAAAGGSRRPRYDEVYFLGSRAGDSGLWAARGRVSGARGVVSLLRIVGPLARSKAFSARRLVEWAKRRFDTELELDDIKNKQRDEIRQVLVEHSRRRMKSRTRWRPKRKRRWPSCSAKSTARRYARRRHRQQRPAR